MDFKSLIKTVAPAIATAIGTPAAGAAVSILSNLIFKEDNKSEQDIQNAILDGLPKETVLDIRKADQDFAIQMSKIANESQQFYLLDVQDARKHNADNPQIFTLGYVILLIFFISMLVQVVFGFFVVNGKIEIQEVGLIAAFFSLLGNISGATGTMAQQVIGFWFGSSSSSHRKSEQMADAIKNSIK